MKYSAIQMALYLLQARTDTCSKNHVFVYSYTWFCNYVYVYAFKLKGFSFAQVQRVILSSFIFMYFHVFIYFLVFQVPFAHQLRLLNASWLTLYCISNKACINSHINMYVWIIYTTLNLQELCYVCNVIIEMYLKKMIHGTWDIRFSWSCMHTQVRNKGIPNFLTL